MSKSTTMSKRIFYLICAAIVTMTIATSCHKDEPETNGSNGNNSNDNTEQPDATKPHTYTVMLYGVGGGNLDEQFFFNFEQMMYENGNENVKVTGLVKFSEPYQDNVQLNGVRRFVLDGTVEGSIEEYLEKVGPANQPFYSPQYLADFIKWSKDNYPADDYILILWNHGSGWHPYDDFPKMRGILSDDNMSYLAMSSFELAEALELSGVKLKMLYFDACLMNMLEVLTEIKDGTEMVLASGHLVSSMGGDYVSLLSLLKEAAVGEITFEEAMECYVKDVVSHWSGVYDEELEQYGGDLCLSRLDKIDQVNSVLKDMATEIMNFYRTGSRSDINYFEEYAGLAYTYDRSESDCYDFVDVMDLAEKMTSTTFSAPFVGMVSKLRRAVEAMTVCQAAVRTMATRPVTYSVTLVNKSIWVEEEYEWAGYTKTAFDKATGWSAFLQKNNIELYHPYEDE